MVNVKPTGVRRERPTRRAFTNEHVVDTALSLMDEGGPAAVSIRSVAARLGVNPNAVYTYVSSRAELESKVADLVLSRVQLSLLTTTDVGWQDRIVEFAVALRAELLAHPAVAQLLMTAPMDGPASRAISEALLEAMAGAGIDDETAARATYLLIVQVIGSVAMEVAEADAKLPLPSNLERVTARRSRLAGVDAVAWPRTVAAADVMARWVSPDQFAWGLRRVLEGIAHVG